MQRCIIKLATTVSNCGFRVLWRTMQAVLQGCQFKTQKKGTFVYQLLSPIRQGWLREVNSVVLPVLWMHEYICTSQGGTERVQGRKREIHWDKVLWTILRWTSACCSNGQSGEVSWETVRQNLWWLTHLPVEFSIFTVKNYTMTHPQTAKVVGSSNKKRAADLSSKVFDQ